MPAHFVTLLFRAKNEMSKPAKKQESVADFTVNFLMGGVSAAVSKVREKEIKEDARKDAPS